MTESQHTTELARDLGFLEAFTLGVGTMIGAGIFILPSIAAESAGPASMFSFLIGGFVSLLAAISLSELATGMPRAGGSYYYVNRAMGSLFGSVVGWGMWMGLMFATAFYMLGFGQYMTYFFPAIRVDLVALAMAALLVYINYRGAKDASVVQNLIVVLLLGLIIVFVSIGIFQIDGDLLDPFNPNGWGAVTGLAATLYVSFIGFEVIATSAEEIKNPARNLPLAMIAAVLTPMLLYAMVMIVATGMLPAEVLADSKIPVADVATEFLGEWGALLMVVGAVLATVSSANASILSAARVNFAMGRDRILSNWLNEIHRRFQTPYRAIIVTGILILVMIGVGVGIETLADVASFSFLVTYALVHVAVIVMRRASPPDYEPDFKIPGLLYPLIPVVGLLSCVIILLQMRPLVLGVGSGLLIMGAGWFVIYARTRATGEHLIGEAIVAEKVRAPTREPGFRVVVPVANPATETLMLKMAVAAIHQHENAEIVVVNVVEVPPQASPAQHLEFERTRIARQQKLLDAASETATNLGVSVRTRAILSRDPAEAILKVVREEAAQRLVIGWKGHRKKREFVLGSTIDRVITDAPCEVNLVKAGPDRIGDVVALVGTGPSTDLAAREAMQIHDVDDSGTLTLLNVQRGGEDEAEAAEAAGELRIKEVAKKAGLADDDYVARVAVGEDVEQTLIEAVMAYDTICIGATRTGVIKQALFGSIPERVGEEAPGTVLIVDQKQRPRTIVEAVIERLTGR